MRIITKLINQAEKTIGAKLKIIDKDIEDFTSPMNLSKNPEKRNEILKEWMTGRLSSKNLTKNYSRKRELLMELTEIDNFKWRHKDWFKIN